MYIKSACTETQHPYQSPANIFFTVTLAALMAFASLSTDIYLPAMPAMQEDLVGDVELTITGFLIGFSVAQLIWGPISDRIGRRKPLFLGMILFVIGSAGCALSQNIEQMVFWRVFQALGASTGPMLARAMIRDLYAGSKAAQMLSTLIMIMAIAPIIGPVIGGQLLIAGSWQAIFWLLSAIGLIMFVLLFWLPETLPPGKRISTPTPGVFADYGALLKNGQFMRYTLSITFFYVGVYAFISGSPLVYINYYGVDPEHYGWLFALNVVGLIGLSLVNRSLVGRFSIDRLLCTATIIAVTAMLILVLFVKLNIGGFYSVIFLIFIFFSMNGIIAACATAAALESVPKIAGSASAAIGSLQYGSGIISSILLALLSEGTPWTMTCIMAVFALLSATMAIWASRSHNRSRYVEVCKTSKT